MNESKLPPDLADVERRLAECPRAQPSAALRQRVLSSLHNERMTRRRRFPWRIAATLAAAVLLSLNLALSLANHPARSGRDRWENADLETIVAGLRQKSPEMTEAEAYWLASLARSTRVLSAAP
jgi:hypothetical protein